MEFNREDLAWAAGFIEGEGSFLSNITYHNKNSGRAYVTFQVSAVQVEQEPLEKLLRIFNFGRIHGPYSRKDNKSQPFYRFSTNSFEGSQAITAALWPWLSQKRKQQAKAALLKTLELLRAPHAKPITRPSRIAICHPMAKHLAKGLCSACYQKGWRENGCK